MVDNAINIEKTIKKLDISVMYILNSGFVLKKIIEN
jgi:hypothetical protein